MKKRKHHKTCMHCAFMHAYRTKYKHIKTDKEKQKAFNALVRSAIKITSLVFSRTDMEQQSRFMSEVVVESGALGRAVKEVMEKATPSEAKGPTKH